MDQFAATDATVTAHELGHKYVLRRLDLIGGFSIIYKADNFCDFSFDFLHIKTLLKRGTAKTKEFSPSRNKFFPFRVNPPFLEGRQHFYRYLP